MKLYITCFVVLLCTLFAISCSHIPFTLAQPGDAKDPTQLREDYKKGKESIQNEIKIEFDQLLAVIENELGLKSIESHLSLASQYNIQGKIPEAKSELQKADDSWHNSTMTAMNVGNEFISVAKDNSTLLTHGERVILDHFGNIIVKLGTDIENLRIQLNG